MTEDTEKDKPQPKPKGRRQRRPVTIDLEASSTGGEDKTEPASKTGAKEAAKTDSPSTAASKKTGARQTTPDATQKSETAKNKSAPTAPKAASSGPRPERPATPDRERRGGYATRRIIRTLAAAAVGGVIALGAVYGLNRLGVLPAVIGKAPQPIVDRLADLDTRLTKSEAMMRGLSEAQKASASLAERLAALETSMTAAASDRKALAGDLNTTKAALAATDISALTASVKTLRDDVDALRRAVSAGEAGGDAALSALDQRLTKLSATVSGLNGDGSAPPLTALAERVAALEKARSEQESGAKATGGRLDAITAAASALSKRLDRLEATSDTGAAKNAAMAVSVIALQTAFANGRPFAEQLKALSQKMPIETHLSVLKPFELRGLPTDQELAASFRAALPKLRTEKPAGSSDVVGRLFNNARSAVKVRKVSGSADATDAPVLVQLTALVDRKDYKAAHELWTSLPDPEKSSTADWAAGLAARVEADILIDAAFNRITAALNGDE